MANPPTDDLDKYMYEAIAAHKKKALKELVSWIDMRDAKGMKKKYTPMDTDLVAPPPPEDDTGYQDTERGTEAAEKILTTHKDRTTEKDSSELSESDLEEILKRK